MSTPLSHVGQTARPQEQPPQQSQSQGQSQPPPQPPGGHAGHPQQQQADSTPTPDEQRLQRERQQRLVDAEDDPASDANTESANHPNDE